MDDDEPLTESHPLWPKYVKMRKNPMFQALHQAQRTYISGYFLNGIVPTQDDTSRLNKPLTERLANEEADEPEPEPGSLDAKVSKAKEKKQAHEKARKERRKAEKRGEFGESDSKVPDWVEKGREQAAKEKAKGRLNLGGTMYELCLYPLDEPVPPGFGMFATQAAGQYRQKYGKESVTADNVLKVIDEAMKNGLEYEDLLVNSAKAAYRVTIPANDILPGAASVEDDQRCFMLPEPPVDVW